MSYKLCDTLYNPILILPDMHVDSLGTCIVSHYIHVLNNSVDNLHQTADAISILAGMSDYYLPNGLRLNFSCAVSDLRAEFIDDSTDEQHASFE